MELDQYEMELLGLVFLSCEDLVVPQGGCPKCEHKKECWKLQYKLLGRVVTLPPQ